MNVSNIYGTGFALLACVGSSSTKFYVSPTLLISDVIISNNTCPTGAGGSTVFSMNF